MSNLSVWRPEADIGKMVERLESIEDMNALREALQTSFDVISGLCAQPRFFNSSTRQSTPAGDALEALMEYLGRKMDRLFDKVKETSPADDYGKKTKARLLISHAIHYGADEIEIAALASNLAAQQH